MTIDTVHDADLRTLNTFGVRAHARKLLTLCTEAGLTQVAALVQREGMPLVLGGGSNVLLTRNLEQTVLRIDLRGIRLEPVQGTSAGSPVMVDAAAGESWDALVQHTVAHGLWGLENLSLIPGQVGASPIQNIGAYGVEMRDSFESLRAFDLETGEIREFDADACGFGYRDSFFKTSAGKRWLVLSVRFRLARVPRPRLEYGDLRAELAERDAHPSPGHAASPADPKRVADAVAAIRRRKLPDPARIGNAGSFFKNPVVPAAQAEALRLREPDMPVHSSNGGSAKLSAAWLIDRCGWKGTRRGDAGVSERHALVLVNHGNASGAQLLELARDIQRSVMDRFGVSLEPEPSIL